VLKHHSVDPVRLFCDGIRAMGGDPRIAGPMGYVGFMLRGERKTAEFQLYHFHGAGGQSRVTKGQIDIERQMASVRADAIVLGHKHWRRFQSSPGGSPGCDSLFYPVKERPTIGRGANLVTPCGYSSLYLGANRTFQRRITSGSRYWINGPSKSILPSRPNTRTT